jgi:hypothetical protein
VCQVWFSVAPNMPLERPKRLATGEVTMTATTVVPFGVAKPRVSWAISKEPIILFGACLLLTILSYIALANPSFEPKDVAGETIWIIAPK